MIDVSEPIRPIEDVAGYPRVRVFVSDRGELIGSFDVWNARRPITAARLSHDIAERLGYRLAQRAVEGALRERAARGAAAAKRELLPASVPVSVVIPTCGRVDDLRRCLASVLSQRTRRPLEVIVVDNRPSSGSVAALAEEFPAVTFIPESRPGLSFARNTGFAAATGEILVATDDDVVAPRDWIERLVAPFARPEVAVVTGHVLPLELETESQCCFEAYGGLGKGFERVEADGHWFRGFRTGVPTWKLGATANAAFRAAALADPAIGLMDEALGAGTPTGCSEDTDLFYRVLKAGHTLIYEPTAYVWHRHRTDMAALRAQIYAYSKGHVAYHLTTLLRDGDLRALVRLGWSLPKSYVQRLISRLRRGSEYPLSLIPLEIAGNLAGPLALWRSRRRVKRLGASAPFLVRDTTRPPAGDGEAGHTHAVSLESPLAQNPAP